MIVGATLKTVRAGNPLAISPIFKALSEPVRDYVKECLIEDQPGVKSAVEQILTAAVDTRRIPDVAAEFKLNPTSLKFLKEYATYPWATGVAEAIAKEQLKAAKKKSTEAKDAAVKEVKKKQ